MPYIKIVDGVFAVGGGNLSYAGDAYCYLVETPQNKLVLIDCGINSFDKIMENIYDAINTEMRDNIENTSNEQANITIASLILTHFHIDHIGTAHDFKKRYPNIEIIAHILDSRVIEGEDKDFMVKSAASWYNTKYNPIKIDHKIKNEIEQINIGGQEFKILHTPGHTPGSISIIIHKNGKKIVFAQDVHGPFLNTFDSNIDAWKKSMNRLLEEKCDILAEGHYGIYSSKEDVEHFIKKQISLFN
ncbi:MAG: MBL fold metallo-hydrolase [Promethearchaeota archaeon]